MTRLVGKLRAQFAAGRRLEKEIEKNLPRAFSLGLPRLGGGSEHLQPALHFTEPPTPQDVQHVAATVTARVHRMLRRKGLQGEPSHDSNEAPTVDDALDSRPNVGRRSRTLRAHPTCGGPSCCGAASMMCLPPQFVVADLSCCRAAGPVRHALLCIPPAARQGVLDRVPPRAWYPIRSRGTGTTQGVVPDPEQRAVFTP